MRQGNRRNVNKKQGEAKRDKKEDKERMKSKCSNRFERGENAPCSKNQQYGFRGGIKV